MLAFTTANDIFHYWLPIISEALPPTLIEQVKKFEGDYEWLQELLSEIQLIVDTSEQVRERPRGYQEQKEFYSGKKKNHTLKNQFIIRRKASLRKPLEFSEMSNN